MGAPIVQAAAHTNHIINVYADRVEVRSGWQGQTAETLDMREIEGVNIRGLVNCTLTITSNKGRLFQLRRMALPEARDVKKTIENQKRRAGLYE